MRNPHREHLSISVTWWARLRILPLPERLFVLLLLAGALAPAMAPNFLNPSDALAVTGFAALVCVAALVAIERPARLSARAYAAQLAGRWTRVQEAFDGALRRRLEEEHNHEEEPQHR